MRTAAELILVVVLGALISHAPALAVTVQELNSPGVTAQTLANTIMPGVTTSNAVVRKGNSDPANTNPLDPRAFGLFSGGLADGLGIDTGVILSTGLASDATGPNIVQGVSFFFDLPGETDLDALVTPDLTADAAVLEFDFVTQAPSVTFRFVFASEEYLSLNRPLAQSAQSFNDVVGLFVDGANIALVPGTTQPVSVYTVNWDANVQLFVSNDPTDPALPVPGVAPFGTQYDGFTRVLAATAILNPALSSHHVKFVIADTGPFRDMAVDSSVFISSGGRFSDVPPGGFAFDQIEAIAAAGITGGCSANPPLYCPNAGITRGQMAVFIETSLGRPAANCTGTVFADVNASVMSPAFCGYIERLAADGITGGCGGGNYCPDNPVTRGQMAVFIERALGKSPTACLGNVFADVTSTSVGPGFCAFIEQFAADGITSGCGGGNYCPDSPVTRAQMAVFLVTAPPPLVP